MNWISRDFGETWQSVSKSTNTVLVIVPGAGVRSNSRAYYTLTQHFNLIYVNSKTRDDGFDYPSNWRYNPGLILKPSNKSGLLGLANRVGHQILHGPTPSLIICGSRGSQTTIGLVWRHFWRGPTICINAGPLTSRTHIFNEVYPVFITMEHDYFKTQRNTQHKYEQIKAEIDCIHINRLGDSHMPQLSNPAHFLLNVARAAIARRPDTIPINKKYTITTLTGCSAAANGAAAVAASAPKLPKPKPNRVVAATAASKVPNVATASKSPPKNYAAVTAAASKKRTPTKDTNKSSASKQNKHSPATTSAVSIQQVTVDSQYAYTWLRQNPLSKRKPYTGKVANGTKVNVLNTATDEHGHAMLFITLPDSSLKGWIYSINISQPDTIPINKNDTITTLTGCSAAANGATAVAASAPKLPKPKPNRVVAATAASKVPNVATASKSPPKNYAAVTAAASKKRTPTKDTNKSSASKQNKHSPATTSAVSIQQVTVDSQYAYTWLRQNPLSKRKPYTGKVANGTKVNVLNTATDEHGHAMLFITLPDSSLKGWIYSINISQLR